MATEAKVEATFPQISQDRRTPRVTSLRSRLSSTLETPAVNVLLAGVEKRPDAAALGDLMDFMATYNLRSAPPKQIGQKAAHMQALPDGLAKLR